MIWTNVLSKNVWKEIQNHIYQHLLGHVVDTKTIHSIVSAGQMSHKHFYRFVNIVYEQSIFALYYL